MKSLKNSWFIFFIYALLPNIPAFADETAQQSMRSLIISGSKIISINEVQLEPTKSNGSQQIVITLVKDNSVSVCTLTLGAWENLTHDTTNYDDPKMCDTRTFK